MLLFRAGIYEIPTPFELEARPRCPYITSLISLIINFAWWTVWHAHAAKTLINYEEKKTSEKESERIDAVIQRKE